MGKKDWPKQAEIPHQTSTREVFGYGVEKSGEKWVAYKISTRGEYIALTPLRNGVAAEDKARALSRLRDAIETEYLRVGPRMVAGG